MMFISDGSDPKREKNQYGRIAFYMKREIHGGYDSCLTTVDRVSFTKTLGPLSMALG